MRFDRHELARAVECVGDLLKQPADAFSLESGCFAACYKSDGCYYLLCRNRVSLRLSEQEARQLHFELASAQAALESVGGSSSPARVM
jgi:hypothetical protein